MPATRLLLLTFSSLPMTFVASGEMVPGAANDPRPMLLWYVAIAVPSLMTMFLGVLSAIDFFSRRAKEQKAEGLGGYVTHPQFMSELGKVYEEVKRAVKDATHELTTEIKELRRATSTHTEDISRIEGRMEGMPPRRRNPLP